MLRLIRSTGIRAAIRPTTIKSIPTAAAAAAAASISIRYSIINNISSRSLNSTIATNSTAASVSNNNPGQSPPLSQIITDKLHSTFSPVYCDIIDTSGGCGTFFRIDIYSTKFDNISLIQQHRLINELLKSEIKLIHGLTLNTMNTKQFKLREAQLKQQKSQKS